MYDEFIIRVSTKEDGLAMIDSHFTDFIFKTKNENLSILSNFISLNMEGNNDDDNKKQKSVNLGNYRIDNLSGFFYIIFSNS